MSIGYRPTYVPIQGATILGDGPIFPRVAAPLTEEELRVQYEAEARQQIRRRIRFLEPPAITAHWRQGYLRLQGKIPWLPTYGMTGTIIGVPAFGMIGAGPTVRWDDGHVSTLGSVSRYEYV